MGDPEAGAHAEEEARRLWLERIQRAAQRAHDDLGEPSDPSVKDLTTDLEQLVAHLERELGESPNGESGTSSGIS